MKANLYARNVSGAMLHVEDTGKISNGVRLENHIAMISLMGERVSICMKITESL